MSDRLLSSPLLAISLEEYFQADEYRAWIPANQWYRFAPRLQVAVDNLLALLARANSRATFFVPGWVAEHRADVVRRIAAAGHEIAASNFGDRPLSELTIEEIRTDIARSRELVAAAGGCAPLGFRVFGPLPAGPRAMLLDTLTELGFRYDASFVDDAGRAEPRRHVAPAGCLWTLPRLVRKIGLRSAPIDAAGAWAAAAEWTARRARRLWRSASESPLLFVRAWEIDAGQPRLSIGPSAIRHRQERILRRTPELFAAVLADAPARTVADHLRLAPELTATRTEVPSVPAPSTPMPVFAGAAPRTPVSIVVPCFNEEGSIEYLANTLRSVAARLGARYELRFVMVDDGSRDATFADLTREFGGRREFTLVRHQDNRGVAAAILTGIHAAETEIVCSIDCDCTYDPHELERMIPLLSTGVDLVTASPYHPAGGVRNVPEWRLALSRGASFLYRRLSRRKLHTYTSCFRVYRRGAIVDLPVREEGFLGIAELVWRLDERHARIVEHPAVLESRVLGQSKMKVWRTIRGHLRLLGRMAASRLLSFRALPREGVRREATPEAVGSPGRAATKA